MVRQPPSRARRLAVPRIVLVVAALAAATMPLALPLTRAAAAVFDPSVPYGPCPTPAAGQTWDSVSATNQCYVPLPAQFGTAQAPATISPNTPGTYSVTTPLPVCNSAGGSNNSANLPCTSNILVSGGLSYVAANGSPRAQLQVLESTPSYTSCGPPGCSIDVTLLHGSPYEFAYTGYGVVNVGTMDVDTNGPLPGYNSALVAGSLTEYDTPIPIELPVSVAWPLAQTTPPTVGFTWNGTGTPNQFAFSSTSVANGGATLTRYDWDFGDGTTAANGGPTPTHTYAAEAATRTIKLTVTDSNGLTASTTIDMVPHLSITGFPTSPTKPNAGQPFTFTVTVDNDGPTTLPAVTPTMVLSPASLQLTSGFVPASADLAPGQTGTFIVSAQGSVAVQGTATVDASSGAVHATERVGNVTLGNPGLTVDLQAGITTVGKSFLVQELVGNAGADPVTGLTWNDPSGLLTETVTPASGPPPVGPPVVRTSGPYTLSGGLPTSLQPGETVDISYQYNAPNLGQAVLTAAVTGTLPDATTTSGSQALTVTVSAAGLGGSDVNRVVLGVLDQVGASNQLQLNQADQILATSAFGVTTSPGLTGPTAEQSQIASQLGVPPQFAPLIDPNHLDSVDVFMANFADHINARMAGAALGAGQLGYNFAAIAFNPQSYVQLAGATLSAVEALPSATWTNLGYLGQAAQASLTPGGVQVSSQALNGLYDNGQQLLTQLNASWQTFVATSSQAVAASRDLYTQNPAAYWAQVGGIAGDVTAEGAIQGAVLLAGDGALKAVGPVASKVAGESLQVLKTAAARITGDAGLASAAGDSTEALLSQAESAMSKYQALPAGTALSVDQAAAAGGILPSDQAAIDTIIGNVKTQFGVDLEVGVRTSEPLSAGLDVTPKPELIKPKATSALDMLLGAPPGTAGTTTIFEPNPLSVAQVNAYETAQPGFRAAYTDRYLSQLDLWNSWQKSSATDPTSKFYGLKVLAEAGNSGQAVTALVARPGFVKPPNLIYLEQLESPEWQAANGMTTSDAMSWFDRLKYGDAAQGIAPYPDQLAVKIQTVANPDGSISFIDGLKNRPYGSDMDVQYVRPANGGSWPVGARGQIETYVQSQMRTTVARFPNHGWSDSAFDLASQYMELGHQYILTTSDPAVAAKTADILAARYQTAAKLLRQQAALATDPATQAKLIALAQKFEGTTAATLLGKYTPGEKIIVFTRGDVRVGHNPVPLAVFAPAVRFATVGSGAATSGAAARFRPAAALTPTVAFTVNTTADTTSPGACAAGTVGACTLREALTEATAIPLPVTITVPAGTFTPATPLPTVTGEVTVTGAGQSTTTIDGSSAGALFSVTAASLTLNQLTVANALTSGPDAQAGAAVTADDAVLTATDTTFTNDRTDAQGGAVAAGDQSILSLTRTTFSGDFADSGGAVYTADTTVTIADSTFTGDGAAHLGGAVLVRFAPSLSVTGTTFTNDTAGSAGGGLYVEGVDATNGTFTLSGDTFTTDTAGDQGGAVDVEHLVTWNGPETTLMVGTTTFTTDSAATGGAVFSAGAPLSIDTATLTANAAVSGPGGAVAADGPLTLTNSTLTGNTSATDGGAVASTGTAAFSGDTFNANAADNLGGALALLGPDPIQASGLTFTANTAGTDGAAAWRDGGTFSPAATTFSANASDGGDIAVTNSPAATPAPVALPGGNSPAVAAGGPTVTRSAGDDRIATAITTADRRWPTGAKAVVLARSDDFADALAGIALAAAKSGPLLVTPSSDLDPRVATALTRLLAPGATVYALGGGAALSDRVTAAVDALGFHLVRLAGADRYATAVAVADALGDPAKVIEVTGTDFPDGLTAGPAAAQTGAAVLLTAGPTQASATADYLAAHPGPRWAVGGPAAAADPTATPVAGVDRYATAVAVAVTFFGPPTEIGLATGAEPADALAGGADQAALHAPLLLTDSSQLPSAVAGYLAGVSATLTDVTVYGGPAAVSDTVTAQIG